MGWRLAIVSVVLAGCGRVNYEPRSRYRDVVMEDSPLAYWRLGDDDGIARDETGWADGAYAMGCTRGAPGAIADDPDSAVRFDGTSCLVSVPDGFEFSGLSPFSLEVWVSVRSSRDYFHVFTREDRTIWPGNGYALLQISGGFKIERSANGMLISTAVVPIVANRFTHVVGTYDGMTLRVYVDGTLAEERPDTAAIPMHASTTILGAHENGAYVDGVMDELAVYDHALSAERIALHHRIGTFGAN